MRTLLVALALLACAAPARAQEDRLAPLLFLNGCWTGTFEGGSVRDDRCFEPMLDGRALRDRHTVVGVGYGGETIYAWNAETRRIEVTYFANDGGLMTGRVAEEDGVLWMRDGRYVSPRGDVQNLRSRWVRTAEGFVTETEREDGGEWRPLMRIRYVRAAAE